MAAGQAVTQSVLSLCDHWRIPAPREPSCGRSPKGLCPLNPEVYRFIPQGLATGIYSVSMQQKRAIPYGTAPSEASRRSGRTSALPYPPLLALLFYHDSPLSSTVVNSIVLDMGSTLINLHGRYGIIDRLPGNPHQHWVPGAELLIPILQALTHSV